MRTPYVGSGQVRSFEEFATIYFACNPAEVPEAMLAARASPPITSKET